jgi:hypothetical protein
MKPHARQSRLSGFFKRHTRRLSMVGALIVFTTFVVKDAIRDSAKETIDSLDSEEAVFAIRNDSLNMFLELNGISEHVDQVWDTTPGRAKFLRKNAKGSLGTDYDKQREFDDQIHAELENVKRLVIKMPHSDATLLTYKNQLQQRFDDLRTEEQAFDKKVLDPAISEDDALDDESQLGADSETLGGDIEQFAARALVLLGHKRTF